jgi:hypothetical protein
MICTSVAQSGLRTKCVRSIKSSLRWQDFVLPHRPARRAWTVTWPSTQRLMRSFLVRRTRTPCPATGPTTVAVGKCSSPNAHHHKAKRPKVRCVQLVLCASMLGAAPAHPQSRSITIASDGTPGCKTTWTGGQGRHTPACWQYPHSTQYLIPCRMRR